MRTLRVYVCTNHDCHYPVGVASIIVAATEADAIELLDEQLRNRGLRGHKEYPYTLTQIYTIVPQAIVLQDGNY